ncbi:MaoC family domain-containing protein, partial [Toxoplasma gondii FOU]
STAKWLRWVASSDPSSTASAPSASPLGSSSSLSWQTSLNASLRCLVDSPLLSLLATSSASRCGFLPRKARRGTKRRFSSMSSIAQETTKCASKTASSQFVAPACKSPNCDSKRRFLPREIDSCVMWTSKPHTHTHTQAYTCIFYRAL